MRSNAVDIKEQIPARRLAACVFVVALSGGLVGCGGTEERGGVDGGTIGGGSDGGSIGQSSSVYLACKLNGESVRIEGTGAVVADYQVKEDETVVQTGGPQKYRFLLVVPGQNTGSWTLGDGYLSLSVTELDDMTIWQATTDQEDKGAALQVSLTAYGSVGGYVEGTFVGTGVSLSDGSRLEITDGEFRASRIQDISQ
jgi:hypothetical protein